MYISLMDKKLKDVAMEIWMKVFYSIRSWETLVYTPWKNSQEHKSLETCLNSQSLTMMFAKHVNLGSKLGSS